MTDRPRRRAIPVAIKRQVCARQKGLCRCGCGLKISEKPKTGTKFDHRPSLRMRNISADGKDYDPPQHSADHIDAICREEHDRRTYGSGATTAFADAGAHKRERKRGKPPKPKRPIPQRARQWAKGRKLQGRGFQKKGQVR